ncbi:MAG: AAA family ATPase [Bacteroidales bacterium]
MGAKIGSKFKEVNMLDQDDIACLIRQQFPFEPSLGQAQLIQKLAKFIYGFRQPDAFVLKGYAGTGKTTLVGALVRALPSLRIRTVLLAPTGRAAKVLAHYSGVQAYTIHKKIYQNQSDEFGRIVLSLQENKYRNTLFIVDEASMLPDDMQTEDALLGYRSLLEDLLVYISKGFQCKLMLIGDTAQLPPVGSDLSPALDIEFLHANFGIDIQSFELNQVLRQESTSGILQNATAIREKIGIDDLSLPLFHIDAKMPDVISLQGDELEDALFTSYSKLEREDIVIITRSNKRANLFNKEIRLRILGQENEISAGDYLMVLKNNYFWLPKTSQVGFIANGDTIEILKIKKTEEIYGLRFADVEVRLVDYPNEPTCEVKIILDSIDIEAASLSQVQLKNLWEAVMEDYMDIPQKYRRMQAIKADPYYNALQVKFAYSLTCHKTQGGQWNTVFIDQGYFVDDMLTKEYFRWIYTALTRATQKVYLLNFKAEFIEIKN